MNPTLYGTLLIAGVGTLIAMTLASTGQGVSAAFVAGVMVWAVGYLCMERQRGERAVAQRKREHDHELQVIRARAANAGAEGGSE